jgi:hypothetical protein
MLHPFEKSGLGKAPFRFVGHTVKIGPLQMLDKDGNWDGMSWVGSEGQPMGVCDHCCQGIAICCEIVSSDGKRSVVGCDCVEKTYREFTTDERNDLVRKVKEAKRAHSRQVRHAREERKIKEAWELFRSRQAELEMVPDAAQPEQSMADRFVWMMDNGGNRGKSGMLKELQDALQMDEDRLQMLRRVGAERVAKREKAAQAAKEQARKREERRKAASDRAAWIVDGIRYADRGAGTFVMNTIRNLENGGWDNLWDNQKTIVREIWAKQAGRKGSKAFQAKAEEFDRLLAETHQE